MGVNRRPAPDWKQFEHALSDTLNQQEMELFRAMLYFFYDPNDSNEISLKTTLQNQNALEAIREKVDHLMRERYPLFDDEHGAMPT